MTDAHDPTPAAGPTLADRLQFFKQVPLFADLTDAELTALVQDCVRRELPAGEILFEQGDPGEVLYLIESGQVRIFVAGRDGQELSVIMHGPGDIFGEMALIDSLPRSASALVTEDAAVYALGRDRLREHMRRSFQLAMNFMIGLSMRLRYSSEMVGNLAMLDVSSRLARKLLALAQSQGEPEGQGVRITQSYSQSELASLVGATRESINKALAHFRRDGLVTMEQGVITLLDPERLRDISC